MGERQRAARAERRLDHAGRHRPRDLDRSGSAHWSPRPPSGSPGPWPSPWPGSTPCPGGRVELGLGAGWYEAEHTAYGIPFPPVVERFDRLEEQLAVITGLWGTPDGATFTLEGRHYQVVDSPALPKPVQRPGPPIIVGGHGAKRTPRLAATYAAEFNLAFSSLEETGTQFERVRAACEAQGRDPDVAGLLGRPGHLLRPHRCRGGGPGRGHRPGGRRAAHQRAVRLTRRGAGQAGHLRRGRGRPGLPADPRPRPTSTTWPSSPSRCCPTAPRCEPGDRPPSGRRQAQTGGGGVGGHRRPWATGRPPG